jgi:hypothetical protein
MVVTATLWLFWGFVLGNYYHNGSVEFRSITSTSWHVYDNRVLVFLISQLHVGSISNSCHRYLSEFKETLKTKYRAVLSVQM